jgi:tetratricopeptide (TPR) repeat protein
MERSNKVPADITRRQALAKILHIPPLLLGLGSIEQICPEQNTDEQITPVILHSRLSPDLSPYETRIRTFWLLNETSQAHSVLEDTLISIAQLEALEPQAGGNFQHHIYELLYSHYRLASRIHRDLMNLPTAYYYANHAVRITKHLARNDFIATSLFVRGFICLVWGLHGKDVASGILCFQHDKLVEALQNFEQALPLARPQLKGILQLEMSRVQAILSHSAIDITIALKTMDLAGKLVDCETRSADSYTNILLDARVKGLDEEEYLLGRAITFNALGRSQRALEELDALDRLDERKRRGKDQTRHYAWLELVQAQTYLGMKEYYIATDKATKAFLVLRDLDSLDNIAFVHDIYHTLCSSSYQENAEVKKLGKMLTRYHHSH